MFGITFICCYTWQIIVFECECFMKNGRKKTNRKFSMERIFYFLFFCRDKSNWSLHWSTRDTFQEQVCSVNSSSELPRPVLTLLIHALSILIGILHHKKLASYFTFLSWFEEINLRLTRTVWCRYLFRSKFGNLGGRGFELPPRLVFLGIKNGISAYFLLIVSSLIVDLTLK